LYVRSFIPVQSFFEASTIGFEESAWCIAELCMSSLIIGVCYSSPSSEELNNDRLLLMLDRASKYCNKGSSSEHLLLVGDFNYPEISYNNFTVDANTDSSAYKFFSKTQDLFLTQSVVQHTRIRADNVPSTLDYILTDEAGLVDDIEYQAPLGKSDHVCLSWKTTVFDSDAKKPVPSAKRNFWKGNYSVINSELSEVNWDKVVGIGSVP
jgi:Endonuclease-reverse transcriptase